MRAILEQLLEEGVIDNFDIDDEGERLTVNIETHHSSSVVRSRFRTAQGRQASQRAVVFVRQTPVPKKKLQLCRV